MITKDSTVKPVLSSYFRIKCLIFRAFFAMLKGMTTAQDHPGAVDLMQLLESLQEQVIELAAIKQAAKDYVTIREVVKPFSITNDEPGEKAAAYQYLKSLVYD